jgi:hypothetical protein
MSGNSYITRATGKPRLKNISARLVTAATFLMAACALMAGQSSRSRNPDVRLDADGLAPRSIEELTGTAIARCYASAWREMEVALESNEGQEVGEEFVGFAKNRLVKRVSEQQETGIHVRIVDHGHQLKAIFYSTDGSAMQLRDRAQLEIQTYDGNKLLDTQTVPHDFIVLMTPGADRWYVRDLEEVSAKSF